LLTIENLKVTYGKKKALKIDSSICIEEGDRIGIIGSNGAGKSTFIKSILGLIKYEGRISTKLKPADISVHMQYNNYSNFMPVKYIIETILNTKISKNLELQELIDFFGFRECLKQKYSTLSGGQKQRLTIILVLIQDTRLVCFDEVTSGLDFETRQKLLEKIIDWYKGRNNAICFVSHYYEELEQLVDKLLLIEEGEVIAFGDKRELFNKVCGDSLIILENTPKNKTLLKGYNIIKSPTHLIAISCKDIRDEIELSSLLINNDINFKRSCNDIEILSINAINNYKQMGV